MINKICSEEINGEQIIFLPTIKSHKKILICLYIFLNVNSIYLLYSLFKNNYYSFLAFCFTIFSCIGCTGFCIISFLEQKFCHQNYKLKIIKMSRNYAYNSLIIQSDNNIINKPLENIKYFSNLKENGKGIYLELIEGNAIKIASYEYEDSIVERAVLEFNKCFDKLLIKESLIASIL